MFIDRLTQIYYLRSFLAKKFGTTRTYFVLRNGRQKDCSGETVAIKNIYGVQTFETYFILSLNIVRKG